jgi:peptidoglycan/xylan/chitin deacetylase (PgdA/CDA1 family)
MKNLTRVILLLIFVSTLHASEKSWIRINQMGYQPGSVKVAVFVSKENVTIKDFEIKDALTDRTIFSSKTVKPYGAYGPFTASFRLYFSAFKTSGSYYIYAGGIKSPSFRIADDVYKGTADFILNYMREQQSGYNPFLKDSCHTHDGFIVYNQQMEGQHINVSGGWHDASDYLQYATTSANAVYQMLFAYEQNPAVYGDHYDCNGDNAPNGIPDILDEAKWGLDWLVKMNPSKGVMFNQLADDRDHANFRLPSEDKVVYDSRWPGRPVYFCTGEPQGLFKYKNRTTGVASTAGKYASAFALGSKLLAKYYPAFADSISHKAYDAYEFGKEKPGVCQTAPGTQPYFYEEDNWTDDMELAAYELYRNSKKSEYLNDAVEYGRKEPVTPWMGADTARHYEWYPFVNLGHYRLSLDKKEGKEFTGFLKKGIEGVFKRGSGNPFLNGIPFIWCSNNLVAAMLTQLRLYYKNTKDGKYTEMEAALRDWLFGCNPWGTSMIIGLPEEGDYPSDPHSSLTHLHHYRLDGGLVDGPVYNTIFSSLHGLKLGSADEYSEFQSSRAVYHDDWGDYSTNEPTMDGTASLSYYLSSLENESGITAGSCDGIDRYKGAIVRTQRDKKEIHLVFTGDGFGDGGDTIRKTLKNNGIKASFFLTGNFYRNPLFCNLLKALKADGNYLGSHSDKHLLYATWEKRDSTIVTKEQFTEDLKNCYREMAKFGIEKKDATYFLPPYEWYNEEIARWTEELGLKLVNFSTGTKSNHDYKIPSMGSSYISSDLIYNDILNYEKNNPDGLNGFILLLHIGTDPERTDKMYYKLDSLVKELKSRGYSFTLLNVK